MIVQFCELCQSEPATGVLTGYFANLTDEVMDVLCCSGCAQKALDNANDPQYTTPER